MYRIDAHQHFWRYDPVEYEWIDDAMASIRRDFLPRDLRQEIASANVHAVVSVQARQTAAETNWLLQLAHEDDFIKGVVGWVPLIEPHIGDTLAPLADNPLLRGVRHVLQAEPDPEYMLRDDFNRGIRAVTALSLTYDILIFERQLPEAIQLVDRHPNQVFVLDHIGKARIAAGELSPWRENLVELARRRNVYCKLSGVATEAGYNSWTEEQTQPYMEIVLDAFGPERTMFGSDWPVCLVAVKYGVWADVVGRSIAKLSTPEQERIWSGTATEAYKL